MVPSDRVEGGHCSHPNMAESVVESDVVKGGISLSTRDLGFGPWRLFPLHSPPGCCGGVFSLLWMFDLREMSIRKFTGKLVRSIYDDKMSFFPTLLRMSHLHCIAEIVFSCIASVCVRLLRYSFLFSHPANHHKCTATPRIVWQSLPKLP